MTTPTDYPDRVRALLEAATPGEWQWFDDRGERGTDEGGIRASTGELVLWLGDSEPYENSHGMCDPEDRALIAEAPTLARAYLAACEEVERLTRVLRVEQGDVTFARDGWSHDIDLTDDGAVREYMWTGPTAYVCGSPNDGWRITNMATGRIGAEVYETALEAMEAADRAAGGAA